MKKIIVLDENEVETLNKNLMIAFALTNQLTLDGENKEKVNAIAKSLKKIIDTFQ